MKGRLKGRSPFKKQSSPSPLKERDTKRESKRGEASLAYNSPSLSKGGG